MIPSFPRVDRSFKYWIAALGGYCGWIYYLSSGPLQFPYYFHGMDKVLHAGAYGVMAAMAWQVLHHAPMVNRAYLGAWAWCALYGMSDEWHQSFTGRMPDVADWLADVTGASLMLLLIHVYFHHMRRQNTVDTTSTNTRLS